MSGEDAFADAYLLAEPEKVPLFGICSCVSRLPASNELPLYPAEITLEIAAH
jgi:hypothetical protein